MAKRKVNRILVFSYHLPMNDEPGAFRPWMEARLMSMAGFSVTVVTSGVQYMTGEDIRPYKSWCTKEKKEDISILRTWAPQDHRRSLLRRILNYLSYTFLAGVAALFKVGAVDRVFAGTDPIFVMPMVYLVSIIKRAGLIMDERDLFPETAVALGVIKKGLLENIFFISQQFFRRRSTALLAATPSIRKKLIAYGHPAQKVGLLYNADPFIDEDLTIADSVQSLRALTQKEFLVGYAGSLGMANDIPVTLRAAERLLDIIGIGFVIIGNGEKKKVYEKYCCSHGVGNVFFLDAVPRPQARKFMSQFDLCLQPLPAGPHFMSTLTSKTFDYHGLGKPMLFCGEGDTADLLEQSGGGIVLPSGDDRALAEAIRELFLDKERRETMGNLARQWFQENIGIHSAIWIVRRTIERL